MQKRPVNMSMSVAGKKKKVKMDPKLWFQCKQTGYNEIQLF